MDRGLSAGHSASEDARGRAYVPAITIFVDALFRRAPMAPRFTLAKDSEQFRSAPKDVPRALRYAASAACRPRELASAALCRVLRGIDEAP
jgi:hypothetical protein